MLKSIFLLLFCLSSLFSSNLKKVTLQLQWKHQFQFAGFYAAKELGYYKDVGLDVKFLEYDGKSSIINNVANNKVDFGLTNASLIARYLKNSPVVFVANYFKQSPLVLITQKEISSPKELKNKKVMGVSDDIDTVTFKLMLEKFGVTENDIQNINTSFKIENFVNKKIDAMLLYTSNELFQLDKKNIKYNIFNPSVYGTEHYDLNLFTSKEFAKNNQDLVIKFREASNKGWKYALENQEEIIDLILKKYNSQNKSKEALLYEAKVTKYLMFSQIEPIGSIDLNKLKNISKSFIEAKYISNENLISLDNFIFDDFINAKKHIPLQKYEKIEKSLTLISKTISEFILEARLNMIIDTFERWIQYSNYDGIIFHNTQLNRYISVWKEKDKLLHLISNSKPNRLKNNQYIEISKNVVINDIVRGTLNIYVDKSKLDLKSKNRKTIVLTEKEKKYLEKKKYITMCIDPDWKPYEWIDENGAHKGLVSKYIKIVEKKINTPIKLVATNTWSESLEKLKSKECEILSFLNKTPQREKFLNFTPIFYEEPEVIVAQTNIPYINGFNDLNEKTVGVVKDYDADEYIKSNHPRINPVYINNNTEGIKLVSEGKIFSTINSLLGTAYLIHKLEVINVKIAGKTKIVNSYRIGISKDEKTLHSILSKAVDSIEDKERDNIFSNFLSIKFEHGTDYELIYKILAVFLIFVIFMIYRYFAIKSIIKKLNAKMQLQLSEIVKKDKMIFQQNKLAAMGEILENIAHQWRQPLSQINSAVMSIDDIAQDNNIHSKELENELKHIEQTTKYMSKTIDDFRSFFYYKDVGSTFLVCESIDKTMNILGKTISHYGIELVLDIPKNIKVKGDINAFNQVMLVLINNSKDAILTREIKKPKISLSLKKEADKVFISIIDNAGGITKDIEEKIFEPYFTTKHKSKGTGLGLYISKVLIETKLEGSILFENIKDGVEFIIELKAIDE